MEEDLLGYIPQDELEDNFELPSKTYSLDLEKGRIGGIVDELEAMKQAIMKVLITSRFDCPIYSDDYGSEIQEETKNAPSQGYMVTILPDLITETLMVDERVIEVGDFNVEAEGDSIKISFIAKTIFGDIEIEEVL